MSNEDEISEDWDTLTDALASARSGDYMVALSRIQSVLSRRPNHLEALIFKGNVLELQALDREQDMASSGVLRSPEMRKARVCYEKALLLQPNNLTVLADLGDHWRYLDNSEKAVKYYDQVIKMGGLTGDERAVDAFVQALEGKIEILEARGDKDDAQTLKQLLPHESKIKNQCG